MITDKDRILEIYQECSLAAYKRQLSCSHRSPEIPLEKMLPFPTHHIRRVYTRHHTEGNGYWFLLADRSIWNQWGEQEPALTINEFAD